MTEVSPGEVGCKKVCPPEVNVEEVQPSQVSPAQIGANVGMDVAPGVPDLHTRFEDGELFFVGHNVASTSCRSQDGRRTARTGAAYFLSCSRKCLRNLATLGAMTIWQ